MIKVLILSVLLSLCAQAAWQPSFRFDAKSLSEFGNETDGRIVLKVAGEDTLRAEIAAPMPWTRCFFTGYLGTPPPAGKTAKRMLKLELDVRGDAFRGNLTLQMLGALRSVQTNSWLRNFRQPVSVTSTWQTVTAYWPFTDDFFGLRVYFFCDKDSVGNLLFRNLRLQEAPYNKRLAEASLPPGGRQISNDDFDDGKLCGWYKSVKTDESYAMSVADGALCLTFKGNERKDRLVYRVGQTMPKLEYGEKAILRMTARAKSPDLQEVKAGLHPLYRTKDGNVSFPPHRLELKITPEWQTVTKEWELNSVDSITSHLFITASQPGTLLLDDIEVKVIPVDTHYVTTGTDGNVINADSGEATVSPARQEELASGSVVVSDLHGHVFPTIPLTSQTPQVTVQLPRRGFYRFVIKAVYKDGSTLDGESAVVVAGPQLSEDVWKKTRFGICSVVGGQHYTADLGGRWDWKFMTWHQAKLDKDGHVIPFCAWNRSPEQRLEAIVAGNGNFPSFLKAANEKNAKLRIYEPADWELYRELIMAMAKGTNLPEWTAVWNEPECSWRDSWEAYVKWMRITAEAIHAVKPNVKVTGPAHCNINMDLIRELGKLGLFDYLDGVTVHPYVNGTAPEGEFIHRIYDLQNYLDSIGKGHLPMFFTEFGWTTGKGGWQPTVDEVTKYRYTTRSLALAATSRVMGIAYFCLHYHVESVSETEFSIVWPDKTPRMALAAYIAICRNLGRYTAPGKWLQLSPSLHLTLFCDDASNGVSKGDMTCVAWNTNGETAVTLPFQPQAAAWSDNAPCALTADNHWTLSPDPLFFQTSDTSLFNVEKVAPRTCFAGAKLPLAAAPSFVPSPLSWQNGVLSVPLDAARGTYTVLTRENNQWRAHEFIVNDALVIKGTRLAQAADGSLQLVATVMSSLAQPVAVKLNVTQGTRRFSGQPTTVPAGATCDITVAVQPAEHLADSWAAVIAAPADAALCAPSEPAKANLGVLNCHRVSGQVIDWSRIPAVTASEFKSLDAKMPLAEAADCSAQLQLAYDDSALLLRIAVRDNDHLFTVEAPEMWRQDSIQLGIDADGGKPFSPNMQFGFNGHRIFEYGFAGKTDGSTVNWRWLAYHPIIKAQTVEPLITTSFNRDGDMSVYVIRIPYAAIGLDRAPQSGETFSLALLINDADSKLYPAAKKEQQFEAGLRHGLSLFNGIVGEKRFAEYGLVFFR